MDTTVAPLDPIVLAQADLLAMIEPRIGPVCDLRFRLADERGAFDWTGTLAGTGEAITGTCTMTLVTDGVNIWPEIQEIVVQGRGMIRRMHSTRATSWAEIVGGSAAMIDTAEHGAVA
jgi:hypothetical protein